MKTKMLKKICSFVLAICLVAGTMLSGMGTLKVNAADATTQSADYTTLNLNDLGITDGTYNTTVSGMATMDKVEMKGKVTFPTNGAWNDPYVYIGTNVVATTSGLHMFYNGAGTLYFQALPSNATIVTTSVTPGAPVEFAVAFAYEANGTDVATTITINGNVIYDGVLEGMVGLIGRGFRVGASGAKPVVVESVETPASKEGYEAITFSDCGMLNGTYTTNQSGMALNNVKIVGKYKFPSTGAWGSPGLFIGAKGQGQGNGVHVFYNGVNAIGVQDTNNNNATLCSVSADTIGLSNLYSSLIQIEVGFECQSNGTDVKVTIWMNGVNVYEGVRENLIGKLGTGVTFSGTSDKAVTMQHVCESVTIDAVAPNCTETGLTEGAKCSICDTILVAQEEVPANGHTEETLPGTAASCNATGLTDGTKCSVCGVTILAQEEIPVTAHNTVYHEAITPGCHYDGQIEYWFCKDCEGFWQDAACTQVTNSKSVVLPATGSDNVKHVEAVVSTCTSEGNVEYWYCEDCEQFWLDEACTRLTNRLSVILPACEHNTVHFEAKDPACHYNGQIEYWYCKDCEGFWTDAACTQVTNSKSVVLPATGSDNVKHMEAVASTCTSEGNVEYWYCEDCEQFWLDEACTRLTNRLSVILPALAHNTIHREAITPDCHYEGQVEHWYCQDCDGFWLDAECKQVTNSKSVVLPATGSNNVKHVEAVASTCTSEGNVEYWYCEDCEQFWLDEACTRLTNRLSVILPACEHDTVYHEAITPGCHYDGQIEYWFCEDCEGFWQDAACTQVTNSKNVVRPATGSDNFTHVEAKDPTCISEGNIEYWYCPDCEQFWQDAACTQLTNSKNVLIAALAHNTTHREAITPGCHYDGQIEHWFCEDCEGFWEDAECKRVTTSKSVVLPATGSDNLRHVEAVEPVCHYDGNVEYWHCPDCEQYWTDELLTVKSNSKNVVRPATGSDKLVHFDAVEPGCHYEGNVEYWYCADCEQFWTDALLTVKSNSKNVVRPATGSDNMVHMEAKAPTCTENGNVEYWHCEDCLKFWTNEACTQLTNSKSVILPAAGHKEVKVAAVAATTSKTGLTAGTKCSVCKKVLDGCKVIPKIAKPKATKITKLIGGKKQITIKFKKVKGIKGYEIQLALKKSMKGKKTVTVKASASKKVVKKLKAKKTYYVRIRTYKVVNGSKVYSSWTAKKKVKTKK